MELNTARVVQAAVRAYQDGRLGALRGNATAQAVYRDGSVCLVTAALPRLTLASIRQARHDRLNWLALMRLGYFLAADLKTIEMLSQLQLGYDRCCVPNSHERRRRLRELMKRISSL
jgi:hypothetical protein